MQKLLIATTNPAKLSELSQFLSDLPVKLVSLKDLGINRKAPEIGRTFVQNAIGKARFYFNISGLPTIADDGGLEIAAFGGEPGVASHRLPESDREATDRELIDHTLARIRKLPETERDAQLRLVLVLFLPNGKIHVSQARVQGIIPNQPSSHTTAGFPYRSLLFIPQLHKFYNEAELTPE